MWQVLGMAPGLSQLEIIPFRVAAYDTKVQSTVGCPRNNQIFFGSNRNEPKLNLFRLFFGLFREIKQIFFRFVSVFRTGIETTKTNRKNLQKTNLY
jgi:hypothetical protein